MNAAVETVEFDPFAGGAVERVVPTSEAQREVWLADKLSREASLAFNESVSLRLQGALDPGLLRQALDAVRARHESLRATVGPDGTELLISAPEPFDLPVIDLRGLTQGEPEAELARAAVREVETPFDLERGPLLRAALYVFGDDEHVLLMTAHHIVCDGWSWGLIAQDLGALYAELVGAGPSPDPAAAYGDYVAWEAGEAVSPEMAEHERYWLGRYAGSSLPVLELPTDRPRAPVRGFASRRVDHWVDAALVTQLRQTGAKLGVSLFGALFGGFAVLLSRLSAQDDVVIGVPAAGQSASGMGKLVGHCVNLLPVRSVVDPNVSFESFIRQAGSTLLDAFDHQTLTYGTLLKKLPLRRDPSRLPLVSVMFNLDQAVQLDADGFAGLQVDLRANARRFENFELFVNAVPCDGGLRLECQYNIELFDAASVARWLSVYEQLLRAAVRSPTQPLGTLDGLPAAERAALRALQPALTPVPTGLMHQAFVDQSAATPERVALRDGDRVLSYRELDVRSNRLAHALRARGIRRGERVGLCLSRGADMVVALLAVLKTGGSYVPLDPGFPVARLAYYAEDAKLALLLTESCLAQAPTQWRSDAADRVLYLDRDLTRLDTPDSALETSPADAQPDDPAYVIYTSGSTGKPKGVCVPHRAVANFLASMRREPGLAPDDCLAAVTTLSFDIAVLELMLPLTVGAQVVIVPRETAMDGNLLRDLLQSSGATLMQATPGLWRMLLDTAWQGGPGFRAFVGGEALPPDLALALRARCGAVWNLYGPTETTIWSTAWLVDAEAVQRRGVSIGRPIANTQVWVLDERLQPCPVGVPGELCIAGAGVALGYLDRPELTVERFVGDPMDERSGGRLYRTGDRGRWRNDGLLEHLGRLDFQVKVRGYRIELGEIEAGCNDWPGVVQSVVLAREDRPGDVRLVAYLVLASGVTLDEAALRQHLRARLPDYMLPQHLVTLPVLPLLPNGKIDRKVLPIPERERHDDDAARVPPRNDLERRVLAAMEEVLNLPGLGIRDDFFALGGHSLLAARLTSRLNRDLDLLLPLRTLFESPTAEALAQAVDRAQLSGAPKRAPIVHDPSRLRAPLTPMQERIRFVEELHPGRVVYNTPSAHRLTGPMDRTHFEQAFREIVRRQPALRSVIARRTEGDGYEQQVVPALAFELPFEDLRAWPQADREAELMRRMQAIVDTPLDLYRAPLFRAGLYQLDDEEHAFLFMPHHIIWDGWSFDLLYQEMSAIYSALVEGREPTLTALPVTYADYAEWHARWMQGSEFEQQLRYWKDRFAKAAPSKAPRPDHPRRAGMSGEGAAEWVRVDRDLTERLRGIAREADVTLNMLTMAVYTAMMAGVVDSPAITIGVPVRGRLAAELEPVMGFFNNLLPVQLAVNRQWTVREFLRRLKGELLEVFSYQDVPFERLAAEPEVAAHSQRAGLYQALFSFQDARERTRRWGALNQKSILIFQKGATEDLGLWLMEVPHGLEGGFTYNADIYTAQTAAAFRARYLELLAQVASDPGLTLGALCGSESEAATYLQRLANPASEASGAGATTSVVSARPPMALTGEQQALATIWSQLLDIDLAQIHAGDNFFDLGGDSLLAMRAIEAAAREFGYRIDARRYIYESLAQLAVRADDEAEPALAGEVPPADDASAKPRGLLGRVFGRGRA